MKSTLILLIILGLLFSPAFAGGDDDYNGFKLKDTTPTGNPILIWNCDWDKDEGYLMHADTYLETPFEENKDVKVYAYRPSTDEWFLEHTCTNVDSGGKDCDFYFTVYWGMGETEEKGYADLLRLEVEEGEDVYSKTFNFYISHTRTNREDVIYEKMGEFETMVAGCPAKEAEFSGVVAETIALGAECKLDDSRTTISNAINTLKAYQQAGECEVVTEQPDAPKESIPSEVTKPGTEAEEPEVAPATTAPSTTAPATPESEEGGSACPVGLVLLLTALAGFMRRG
ncbi:MAG: hypothetical protein GY852_09885 [bacterium]|nr:hypothetical protein [bacterium]